MAPNITQENITYYVEGIENEIILRIVAFGVLRRALAPAANIDFVILSKMPI